MCVMDTAARENAMMEKISYKKVSRDCDGGAGMKGLD